MKTVSNTKARKKLAGKKRATGETNYLLQSPANAKRLIESIEQARTGRVRTVKIPR